MADRQSGSGREPFDKLRVGKERAEREVPVKIEVLAPNQRPIQVTDDLSNFWREVYPKLKPALSRRYPRHPPSLFDKLWAMARQASGGSPPVNLCSFSLIHCLAQRQEQVGYDRQKKHGGNQPEQGHDNGRTFDEWRIA